MWKSVTNGTIDYGEGPEQLDSTYWQGIHLVASGYTVGGKPVLLGAMLYAFGGSTTLADAKPSGAVLMNAETLATQRYENLQFLHACQADPTTCPTELDDAYGEGSPENVELQFPLDVGKSWSTPSPDAFLKGQTDSRVVGEVELLVFGDSVATVHVRSFGNYTFREDGEDRTIQVKWDTYYSDAHKAAVHETAVVSAALMDGKGGPSSFNATIERTLVELSLEEVAEPDAVDLYDQLGLWGRRVYPQVSYAGKGKYDITVVASEVPLSGVRAVLLDANRKIVSEHGGLEFDLNLGAGSYILRTEATHNGRILASYERALVAMLSTSGSVDCDTPSANPFGVPVAGSCPDFSFQVKPGPVSLSVYAFVSDALFVGNSGTLALVDDDGAVIASETISGAGVLMLSEAPEENRGTWTLRFTPDDGVQVTVEYDVYGVYDYPEVQQPVP